MIRFFKTPEIAKWLYPSLIWEVDSPDSIYLTFDDGPDPEVTPWVLSELDKYDAKATFFCLGQNISGSESLLKEIKNQLFVLNCLIQMKL